jgi:hypothetical protein
MIDLDNPSLLRKNRGSTTIIPSSVTPVRIPRPHPWKLGQTQYHAEAEWFDAKCRRLRRKLEVFTPTRENGLPEMEVCGGKRGRKEEREQKTRTRSVSPNIYVVGHISL